MERLEHLNQVNDVKVYPVESEEFASYGRILYGYDFSEAISYMEKETAVPQNGNIYIASQEELEALPVIQNISRLLYGGMPVQAGYCNGRNSTYNGFEYHKGSEVNIAVTDFMLVLGHVWDIRDNHYRNKDAQVFFLQKGTAIEMYQTTLHLSPLRLTEEGFKDIVILPKGTNTPLTDEEKEGLSTGDREKELLLMRNKWVLAHPDREPLISQGAYPGIIGENKELFY